MNLKVLLTGAGLEAMYLIWLVWMTVPRFALEVSPVFVELASHVLFNVVVLTIIVVGALINGKK